MDHSGPITVLWAVRLLILAVLLATSALAGPILTVQPVIVQSATSASAIQNDLDFSEVIFSQIGLEVAFLPALSSATLPSNMVFTAQGLAPYIFDSTWQPMPILTLFYVALIDSNPGIRGVSVTLELLSGELRTFVAAAPNRANDTVAHEIAHVLTDYFAYEQPIPGDPAHSGNPLNLLAPGSSRLLPQLLTDVQGNGGNRSQITADQSQAMLASDFVVPEPGSAMLIVIGIGALAWKRYRTTRLAA